MNSEHVLAVVAPLLSLAIAAVIILARIASSLKEDLAYSEQRADGYERMYDERVGRINTLEADLHKQRGVLSATLQELAEVNDNFKATNAKLFKLGRDWENAEAVVKELSQQVHVACGVNQRLYDLIVTTVNGDAQAARKASEDAVERFLKIADAAERRAGDVICEATTIIGGPVDGEEDCECCRKKRLRDRPEPGGRPAAQPGDAGGLLRDGGQGTGWRPGVRQPGGQAHQVHQHRPSGPPAANPVDGADDDAH